MPRDSAVSQRLEPGQPGTTGTTTIVRWVIAVNIAAYFLQLTVVSAADLRAQFGFAAGDFDAWWKVATHMFIHAGFWPLALNMYILWHFGPRVEASWGSGTFAGYYLLCGLGGWFFDLLFVRQGVLIGATAAVLGVMLAYASSWPNEKDRLFGVVPIAVRWAVPTLVIVTLLVGIGVDAGSGGASLTHLGGLVAGWAYLRMAGSMDIDRLRQRVAPVADEPEDVPPRAIPPRSVSRHRADHDARDPDEIVQQSQAAIAERAAAAPHRDASRAAPGGSSSGELNSLLDKISAHGLEALTQAERDQLEKAARRLRGQ
jgi:membrane associated rhomboid family serine protease